MESMDDDFDMLKEAPDEEAKNKIITREDKQ